MTVWIKPGLGRLRQAWALFRQWSGDDAYERYLAHHRAAHPDQAPLSRRAFIRRHHHERFSSGVNRCC
ncbi:MAG TPA: YbdD/YjiX family protein [Candidatus Acidoferrales bacterium]|nr:YbdD/YjiX family protein [Candidatus Acidoferrales bacterium]